MTKFLRNAALAALVTVGSVSTAPFAMAQGLYLDLDEDNPKVIIAPEGRRNRNNDDDDRVERRGPRGCTEDRAIEKARRMGLRRVEVEEVRRRTIRVSGRRDGRRVDVVFGRGERSCPIVR